MTMRRYVLIGALAVCVAIAVFFVYQHVTFQSPPLEQKGEQGFRQIVPGAVKSVVHLYFSDANQSHLTAESRNMVLPDALVDRAKAMIYALIKGPTNALTRTLPKETQLQALYVTNDGVAYVSFNKAISDKHPGGSLSELLSIYSIVNTLSLNLPEIKAVKVLIEGREAKTLAGHIDLQYPFRPDLLMIK
jgi:spore germination protein GerM